jgi:oxygen-independent coproporphyrinogen-3 oxidase
MEEHPPAGGGFDTIYVGGGTPTALPEGDFSRLLSGIGERTGGAREWTVEANPESLDEARLDAAMAAGVNRLSLGVQSLDDGLLALLGRPARAETCHRALALALGRPGLRVSADLMAGLPRATSLAEEALALVDLGLGHLSIYDLVLEEDSRLAAMVGAGAVLLPGEEEAADEREEADALVAARGLKRYEVSNYAREGEEALHNLVYWHMDSYVGIGPGAVSTLFRRPEGQGRGGSLRLEGRRDLLAYAAGASHGHRPEEISAEDSLVECMMMGFRTAFGLDEAGFLERFGFPFRPLVARTAERWRARLGPARPWPLPWAEKKTQAANLALDGRGLNILNAFLVECMEEIDTGRPLGGA